MKTLTIPMLTLIGACSYGQPYLNQDVPLKPTADVYRPLHEGVCILGTAYAGATVIAPGYAVTNAHAYPVIDKQYIETPYMDLALMKIEGGRIAKTEEVKNEDRVTLFGTGCGGDVRVAHGTVARIDMAHCFGSGVSELEPCKSLGMAAVRGFIIEDTDAGEGFSGGPVINEQGSVVGITQGEMYLENKRYIFAYRVEDALKTFEPVMAHPEVADWTSPWWIDPKFLLLILI